MANVANHASGSGAHAPVRRRRRVWPWVLAAVLLAVLVFGGAAGVFGYRFYTQAMQVKAHEEKALSLLGGISDLSNIDDVDAVNRQIAEAQQETAAASEIAHGDLWNKAAGMPQYGDDVTAVQGMTKVVDSLLHESVPGFMKVLTTLKNSNLSEGDGQLNVQPILTAQTDLKTANDSLQKQVETYRALPTPRIAQVKSAYDAGAAQLTKMAGKVDQLSGAFQILPGFLGADQPRTYALMAMTTSEERSSGGLVGSVGTVTTDNGKITVGDFRPNTSYLENISNRRVTPTDDEVRIFKSGPMRMALDIRDLGAFPDTSRTAEAMNQLWQRTAWGAGQQLDGVMTVDPVFLQELVKINGNVTLSDGRVLTGDNTAEFLLNTVYKDYPVWQTDGYFQEVATQTISTMFSNIDLKKLMKVGEAMGSMAQGRHFSMYAFDEGVEKTVRDAGFTAESPSSEEHPEIGVYVNEQNASKIGWYMHRTSKITRTSCETDGSQTYHVEYTMTNTLDADTAYSLPAYIIGVGQNGMPQTYGIEKTLIYPPAGGSISNLKTVGAGSVSNLTKNTLNGKTLYTSVASIAPGQSVTYSFDVRTSTKAVDDLGVDQTPMGWTDPGVTKDVSACAIAK